MIYRDPDWKNYVCSYLMSIVVGGDIDNKKIYIQPVIYQADSPDEAYDKSKENIEGSNNVYKNQYGELVELTCLGINNIQLLQDNWEQIAEQSKDEYGYELPASAHFDIDDQDSLITEKSDLYIFFEGKHKF